ncbi:hypothetical protein JCGZ_21300 [Jatropha curcas]|uniref:Uncharacterized protein n=1 Tax=Jatropha curcas TaxID=180498 RepID=A0A067JMU4_JATCU|nr:uncharacterized protein LOC105649409 [Jatropha curcas]KDP20829.1 hypothetical protein JCGZ_21300 [Jatropha curcas]
MSKKKAFSGNTMTLKDFHGGSIPSDLPLPSAPGVVVRSSEWSGYDRSNSWGGPISRPDHRARPNSSPAIRHLDDKTPFLSHTTHIGRHFDEDERKPLDGVSGPRRTVSDESFRVPPSRVELKPEPVLSGRVSGSVSVTQVASSYSGTVSDGAHMGPSMQNVGGNIGHSVGASHPNVWAARKEMAVGVNEPVQSAWSGVSAVSKLAHASALEKVSSGRWQTKHSSHYQTDVEVIEDFEAEKITSSGGHDGYAYNRMDAVGGREYSDATLARHVERGLKIEDGIQNGRKEYIDHESTRAASYAELKERNLPVHDDRVQPPRTDVRICGPELLPSVPSEALERPKVKLLPRTKPMETPEPSIIDHKQGYKELNNSANVHIETRELRGNNTNAAKSGTAGLESDNQVIERPKLNLKPRSQPLEQSEGNREMGRDALFGGARPREVVLKERGIDDAALSNHDLGHHPDRIKQNVSKTERVPEHAVAGEKTDNLPLDQKAGKKFEKKEQWVDVERVDKQRRNWRNENWRNSRETERQQQQQQQLPQMPQERPPSPESWRKPVEQPKPASPDSASLRYGKTASALELAQAFSKSFSDPKTADQYSGQRSFPGKTQMPFSRLMGPTPRPQINGY